ncbi:MAG: hypothetical protein ACK47B_07070 [Armatimonadota bacterium]
MTGYDAGHVGSERIQHLEAAGISLSWRRRGLPLAGFRNTGALGWIDGEPTIDEHGHFGFNGLFEVALKSDEHRLRGTLNGLSRPLRRKKVRVKSTGEVFETYEVTDDDDPQGKRYIVDVKSITARDRFILDEHPDSGEILKAEIKDSAFKKLVQPKDEHLGQTMLYSHFVTQPWFQHERLGGKPLATPPDVMIMYWGKDVDPKYYGKEPQTYDDPKGLLNAPFKVFTVPYSQRRVDALLLKDREVWAALDAGELPGCDHRRGLLFQDSLGCHTPRKTTGVTPGRFVLTLRKDGP